MAEAPLLIAGALAVAATLPERSNRFSHVCVGACITLLEVVQSFLKRLVVPVPDTRPVTVTGKPAVYAAVFVRANGRVRCREGLSTKVYPVLAGELHPLVEFTGKKDLRTVEGT